MDQKNTKYHCKSGLYFHIIGTQLETIWTRSEKVGQIGHFWVTFLCVLF